MFSSKKTWMLAVGLIMAGAFIMVSAGCDRRDGGADVRLEKREALPPAKTPSQGKLLRIAVGSMITPKEGFVYYRRLLDYVGGKLGRPVQFVARDTYVEVNDLLKRGDLDIAFVCSGAYTVGHDELGQELLVAPEVRGKTVYYSYIIVNKDSRLQKLEDLRGKTFAFTDPHSNTGNFVPTYLLARMKETPETFFKKSVFTYGHDKSITAVAERIVDGAAVDSLVWNYLDKTAPQFTVKTRIIVQSGPYGIPPVVVRPGLDRETKERLKKIFLDIDKDEEGREILKGMMIDRFVTISDAAYDSVREMRKQMAAMKRGNGERN